jgi:hypothetical protein
MEDKPTGYPFEVPFGILKGNASLSEGQHLKNYGITIRYQEPS